MQHSLLTTFLAICLLSGCVSPSVSETQITEPFSCSFTIKGYAGGNYGSVNANDPAWGEVKFKVDPYVDSIPGDPKSALYTPLVNESSVWLSLGGITASATVTRIEVSLDQPQGGQTVDMVKIGVNGASGDIGGFPISDQSLRMTFTSAGAGYLADDTIPNNELRWVGFNDKVMSIGSTANWGVNIILDTIEDFSCSVIGDPPP